MILSEIKTGDMVRIQKPKDGYAWNKEGRMDYLHGKIVTVGRLWSDSRGAYFMHDDWYIYLAWCESVEEMTLAQWEKMSPQERLEWNRPAFESLVSAKDDYDLVVEYLDRDGCWSKAGSVDLTVPVRPKKKYIDPPKEVWFVVNEKGEFVTEEAGSEQEAINWVDGYKHKDAVLRVVKYVIAE